MLSSQREAEVGCVGAPASFAISIRNLQKRYGDVNALAGIDLDIEAGEMFALLGPNGAGKSTLFSILSTLTVPTEGTAQVFGRDVVRECRAVREQIGVVFQDTVVDPALSAQDNLELMARFYGLPRASARARVGEILELLHLSKWKDRPAKTLSGGQRRRLELARALMSEPQVLFLDEATLGLDLDARRTFWVEVRGLAKSGVTILFATHYMEEADVADRIALIDNGRLVAVGKPDAMKRSLGKGVIRLSTDDDSGARSWLAAHGYAVEQNALGLTVTDVEAATQMPLLLRNLPIAVTRVDVSGPTLEDVFLHITGRTLGDGPSHHPKPFFRRMRPR
jgi:ABC-2 type transport system ATP-binding protein